MRHQLIAFVFLSACASDGVSSLVATSSEPPGQNCAAGGTAIATGVDSNHNGELDASEVAQTQYVCNATGGTSSGDLVSVAAEPAGANCPTGGTRIDVGGDANQDGALQASEVRTTHYVCNAAAAQVVQTFTGGLIAIDHNGLATLQQASITPPDNGTVLAIASADAFCSSAAATGYTCGVGTPPSDLCMRLTTSATALGCTQDLSQQDYAWLFPDVTTPMTRVDSFPVTAGATTTVYVRAATGISSTGQVGVWRRSLSLIYVPN